MVRFCASMQLCAWLHAARANVLYMCVCHTYVLCKWMEASQHALQVIVEVLESLHAELGHAHIL